MDFRLAATAASDMQIKWPEGASDAIEKEILDKIDPR